MSVDDVKHALFLWAMEKGYIWDQQSNIVFETTPGPVKIPILPPGHSHYKAFPKAVQSL
jgi:hypothetical protein